MKHEPLFQLSLQELEKLIALIQGIKPDVDHLPDKAKFKLDKLASYFQMQRDVLAEEMDLHKKK
jgi:hypothetical protein